jgi:hypothetical protein
MAARFFANDYVRYYWNLSVNATSPSGSAVNCQISCNKYLMNVATPGVQAMQAGISSLLAAAQAYSRRDPNLTVRTGAFGRTRVGKGTPGDMEHVLNCGVACGALRTTEAELQRWSDAHLGCDCTGFASAYFSYLGVMPIADSVNAGCHYFRTLAMRNNPGNAFVWDFEAISRDDVLLWMDESGTETKRPGHIAVVYGTHPAGEILVGESSGADDGDGHRGPRLNAKRWAEPTGRSGHRKIPIGEGVVIVRVKRLMPAPTSVPT